MGAKVRQCSPQVLTAFTRGNFSKDVQDILPHLDLTILHNRPSKIDLQKLDSTAACEHVGTVLTVSRGVS